MNGSGKSSLVSYIVDNLNIPQKSITYVPQEINAEQSRMILNDVRNCSGEKLGFLMNIVSRLGSRPDLLLGSDLPSPGELRKLLLALGITRSPDIIVMDEPTNHMDLPSMQSLEKALSDCPCCLLLVSHDKFFLNKLTKIEWSIAMHNNEPDNYSLSILNRTEMSKP
jgi:ATPase subunit of ABC transporter with duplicated ATPase domains